MTVGRTSGARANGLATPRARVTLFGAVLVLASFLVAVMASGAFGASHERSAAGGSCVRPYSDTSPWNTPIGDSPVYAADSASRIAEIGGPLTSDPTQYTYPVYKAAKNRRPTPVKIFQAVSQIKAGGQSLRNASSGTLRIPLPKRARATAETGQLIVVDEKSGREWGVFGLERGSKGWTALFGYRFSTKTDGIPAIGSDGAGLASRAGASYLAGLVRACEIARGKIEHALALAYSSPSIAYITPLRGTNGEDGTPGALPIGARVQLDPALTEADITALGCKGSCLTIARALQEYGAYVVGRSGRPKIYVEHSMTAKWKGRMRGSTVSSIPVEALRALDLTGELRITRKLKHTRPRAGKLLTASVEVAPPAADVGSRGTVICKAEVDKKRTLKPVRASLKALPSGSDRAHCAWRIPGKARGLDVNFLVHVVYQHGGVRKDVTLRVRR